MAGQVTFTPSEDDYIAASKAHFIKLIRVGRLARSLRWVAVALPLVGIATFAIGQDIYQTITALGSGLVAGVLVLLVCYPLSYALIPRRARRFYQQQKVLHDKYDYAWDDRGVKYASPRATGAIAWDDFHRWSDTPDMFMFYVNECLFHFLPRRAFSDVQAQDLSATVRLSGLQRF